MHDAYAGARALSSMTGACVRVCVLLLLLLQMGLCRWLSQ